MSPPRSDIRALKHVKRRLVALKAGARRQSKRRHTYPADSKRYLYYIEAYDRVIQMVEEEIRLRS